MIIIIVIIITRRGVVGCIEHVCGFGMKTWYSVINKPISFLSLKLVNIRSLVH